MTGKCDGIFYIVDIVCVVYVCPGGVPILIRTGERRYWCVDRPRYK